VQDETGQQKPNQRGQAELLGGKAANQRDH
jgi:hypothetical protein